MKDGLWGHRVAWVLEFGAGFVLWGLFIGWESAALGGGLVVLVANLPGLIGSLRKTNGDESEDGADDEPEWTVGSAVEVRFERSKRRYVATFGENGPVAPRADRHERRVLEMMRAVGMPPATLVALDADAPRELELVELPRHI